MSYDMCLVRVARAVCFGVWRGGGAGRYGKYRFYLHGWGLACEALPRAVAALWLAVYRYVEPAEGCGAIVRGMQIRERKIRWHNFRAVCSVA